MKCLNKIPSVAFWVIGVLCMLFPARVAGVLPFLLGGVMLAVGLLRGMAYLQNKEFLDPDTPGMGQDIILVVMGVVFWCAGSEAIGLMGVVWGILGLRKAAGTVDQALRKLYRHQKALLLVVEAVVRVILALALLFDPFEKFSAHVVLLGVELIVANVQLPQEESRE